MTEVAAIILAAGLSRRMGEQNKLLLPVGGIPMIRHMVLTYQNIATLPVVVVTGYESTAVGIAIEGTGAEIVFNASFAEGQQTSIVCGLAAIPDASLIFVGLGDQPLLNGHDLQHLLAAHASADPARISIPILDQVRGNPILIPKVLQRHLVKEQNVPGCRAFTRNYPEHVQFHELTNPGFYADVDTPEAYSAFNCQFLEKTR